MSGKVEIHVGTAHCTVLWLASETRISLPSVPTASDDNHSIQLFQAFYISILKDFDNKIQFSDLQLRILLHFRSD
jgi:hypothetical protein